MTRRRISAMMKVVMSVSVFSCDYITRSKSFLGAIGVGRHCKVNFFFKLAGWDFGYCGHFFYLVCEAIGTAANPDLLCQPWVIVKMIVEK
jgi:hypothetical protein